MVAVLVGAVFAAWLVLAGTVMFLAPRLALRVIGGFGSSALVHFGELGLRLAGGAALVVADPVSSAPGIVAPIGWFLILSALVLLIVPRSWHAAYATWWARRLSPVFIRLVAPVAIAAGVVLVSVLVSGPSVPFAASCAAPSNGFVSAGCSVLNLARDLSGADERIEQETEFEARLLELAIATGRYGVMLAQAREILGLAEPSAPAGTPSMESLPDALARISELQAGIARELLADTQIACSRDGLALPLRQLACVTLEKLSPKFAVPVSPVLAEVSARDEALGAIVMRWWDGVCASVPEPPDGEMPVCPIE